MTAYDSVLIGDAKMESFLSLICAGEVWPVAEPDADGLFRGSTSSIPTSVFKASIKSDAFSFLPNFIPFPADEALDTIVSFNQEIDGNDSPYFRVAEVTGEYESFPNLLLPLLLLPDDSYFGSEGTYVDDPKLDGLKDEEAGPLPGRFFLCISLFCISICLILSFAFSFASRSFIY